jgi:hypothetical protein
MSDSFRPSVKFVAKTAAAILAVGAVVGLIWGAAADNQRLIDAGTNMLIAVILLGFFVMLSWVLFSYYKHRGIRAFRR